MTWAKTGSEFPNDLAHAGLSDAAYRTHHEAITYCYSVEAMDLRIPRKSVRRLAGSDNYEMAVMELVATDFWADRGDYYVIIHHADTIRQSLAAQIKKRGTERQRQRAKRRDVGTNVGNDAATNVGNDVGSEVGNDTDAVLVPTLGPTQTDSQELRTEETGLPSNDEISNFDYANDGAA
jgi:hypothetical protein